jgi:hypothetical protein
MEMKDMMALWLAEVERLYNKSGERTPQEQFFLDLTLEFDRARNAGAPGDYLNWLLTQIELYLSGHPDQAMANVIAAAGKAKRKAFGKEARGSA